MLSRSLCSRRMRPIRNEARKPQVVVSARKKIKSDMTETGDKGVSLTSSGQDQEVPIIKKTKAKSW